MELPDPPLTKLQASILVALRHAYSETDPTAGLTYAQMLTHPWLKGLTLPMAKKTVRQLRARSLPLIASYTEASGDYQKGRRPDVFALHPVNAVNDRYVAFYLVSIKNGPKDSDGNRSDFEELVHEDMVAAYARAEYRPPLEEYGWVDSPIPNMIGFRNAIGRAYENIRENFENLIFPKLQIAHRLGYLAEPPTKDGRLRISWRVIAEFNYLVMMNDPFRPEDWKL